LDYSPTGEATSVLNQYYSDANAVSSYARSPIAAASERKIVVNYPNIRFLNPTQTATRADVAAFIYQALVNSGQVTAINSPYVVGQVQQPTTPAVVTIPSGTAILSSMTRQKEFLSPRKKQRL
jgi:hypothetical protein